MFCSIPFSLVRTRFAVFLMSAIRSSSSCFVSAGGSSGRTTLTRGQLLRPCSFDTYSRRTGERTKLHCAFSSPPPRLSGSYRSSPVSLPPRWRSRPWNHPDPQHWPPHRQVPRRHHRSGPVANNNNKVQWMRMGRDGMEIREWLQNCHWMWFTFCPTNCTLFTIYCTHNRSGIRAVSFCLFVSIHRIFHFLLFIKLNV